MILMTRLKDVVGTGRVPEIAQLDIDRVATGIAKHV